MLLAASPLLLFRNPFHPHPTPTLKISYRSTGIGDRRVVLVFGTSNILVAPALLDIGQIAEARYQNVSNGCLIIDLPGSVTSVPPGTVARRPSEALTYRAQYSMTQGGRATTVGGSLHWLHSLIQAALSQKAHLRALE
eukprot:753184-Hanusia_phi.AAC.1